MKRKILCFGDSLTAGYNSEGYSPYSEYLEALLGNRYTVEHIGLCGWTTDDMMNKKDRVHNYDVFDNPWKGIQFQLSSIGPNEMYEYVFILAGTNDLADSSPPATILRNIESLMNISFAKYATLQLHYFNHSNDLYICRSNYVGLLTVPSCRIESFHPDLRDSRLALNSGLRTLVNKYKPRAFLVDASAALPNGPDVTKDQGACWDSDGLHFSPKGSQVLAQTVFDAIEAMI